jgi:hypothetical protein
MRMFMSRKLHKLQAFDDLRDGTRAATNLLVLCAFPADEVIVEFAVDGEGKAVVDEFATAAIGLDELCWVKIHLATDDEVFWKEKERNY